VVVFGQAIGPTQPLFLLSGQRSSDGFITIQTLSMDASGNQAQDRIHDFLRKQLLRREVRVKWRYRHAKDNDNGHDNSRNNDQIKSHLALPDPGVHCNPVRRILYRVASPGLWPAGSRSDLV
jgi:hypothetical protein